jgi:AmiR/NasT family two-component response regulator
MSEDDAYRFLRKQAMAKRVSIGRLSAALVDSEDLLS